MCHVSAGNLEPQMNTVCDCGCDCRCNRPVTISIEEQIRRLEEHKKILKDRIDSIDKKIPGLKTVKEP
jgi:hypothetical protein